MNGLRYKPAFVNLRLLPIGIDYLHIKRDTEVNQLLIRNASMNLCLQLKLGTN